MDGSDWFGLVWLSVPVLSVLIYVALRLARKVGKPEGLPPGRRGGVSRHPAPVSDAPFLSHEEEPKKGNDTT